MRRELKVLRVESPSPKLRSLTLGGPALAGFISASFDDHLKLLLDGGGTEPVRRDYTPRHYDAAAGELTIEFALHGDGPAATRAAQAEPGQSVAIGGPRGSLVIDLDHDWHLLVGDETALPAIARRLPGAWRSCRLKPPPSSLVRWTRPASSASSTPAPPSTCAGWPTPKV